MEVYFCMPEESNGIRAHHILRDSEIDLYSEFLRPSHTRFSKSHLFTNYKELHNKKNMQFVDRSVDRKFLNKQIRIVNKEKGIDKLMPCWASDIEQIKKIQKMQQILLNHGITGRPRE